MTEQYSQQSYALTNNQGRLSDLEEKQRILKDRILIIGKGLIEEKEKNFSELQQIKSNIITLKEEQIQIKNMLQKVVEQLSNTARREELLIIQRQLDLLRSEEKNGDS